MSILGKNVYVGRKPDGSVSLLRHNQAPFTAEAAGIPVPSPRNLARAYMEKVQPDYGFGADWLSTLDEPLDGKYRGSGVAGALGSVYTLARRGVSVANANHAQIRLVLSGYATELGHLRSLDRDNPDDVSAINHQIDDAVTRAVDLIQSRVKMEPTFGVQEADSQAGVPPRKEEGSELQP